MLNLLIVKMKNWNKTGIIKAVLLGIFALANLVMPVKVEAYVGLGMLLLPIIFGSFAIPLIVKINTIFFDFKIVKPNWNDNPLKLKQPLSFFHYFSYFFITGGLSMFLGTFIKFQLVNYFGLSTVFYGIGILIGIWLTLKMKKEVN